MGTFWKSATPSAPKGIVDSLVVVLPTLLWVAFATMVATTYREPISKFLERTTRLKVAGVELEAAAVAIARSADQVKEIPELAAVRDLSRGDPFRVSLIQRWAQMGMSERKLKILLLHDRVETARALRKPFESLGSTVDLGICATEAESLLQRHAYDVVISDIDWSHCAKKVGTPGNGVEFLNYAKVKGFAQPTVFYIINFDPHKGTPAYAAGISNSWYEVLHFVLDVVARQQRAA